jgi:hypothetical protein
MIRRLLLASAVLIGAIAWQGVYSPQPAQAASAVYCAADPGIGSPGARQVTNPNTNVTYTLNGQGCAQIQIGDIGYFQSQGFSLGPAGGSTVFNTGVLAAATTDFVVATLPPSTIIREIIVANLVSTSVTGGLSFGTTANGTDIVTALTCGSACLTFVADSALSKRLFSTTASQAIHMAPVTQGSGANFNVTIIWDYF